MNDHAHTPLHCSSSLLSTPYSTPSLALHLPNPTVSLRLSSSSYPWVLIFWQNFSSPCCEVMTIESKCRITLAGPGPAYLTKREAEERMRLAMIHWWVSLADVAVYSLLLHTSVLHYTMHFTRTRARMIHTHVYARAQQLWEDSNTSLSLFSSTYPGARKDADLMVLTVPAKCRRTTSVVAEDEEEEEEELVAEEEAEEEEPPPLPPPPPRGEGLGRFFLAASGEERLLDDLDDDPPRRTASSRGAVSPGRRRRLYRWGGAAAEAPKAPKAFDPPPLPLPKAPAPKGAVDRGALGPVDLRAVTVAPRCPGPRHMGPSPFSIADGAKWSLLANPCVILEIGYNTEPI